MQLSDSAAVGDDFDYGAFAIGQDVLFDALVSIRLSEIMFLDLHVTYHTQFSIFPVLLNDEERQNPGLRDHAFDMECMPGTDEAG